MADEHAHEGGHGEEGHGEEGHKKGHGGHGGGHGKHEEHEEGVPEWMISFADNALLQMGVFVIMFAMNVGPKAKGPTAAGEQETVTAGMADTAIAIREAFNSPVSLNSKDPNDLPLIKRMKERKEKGEATDNGVKGEKQNVQAQRDTGFTNITATVNFEQGAATISSYDRSVLADAVRKLKGQRWIIEVRGHCSSIEASDGPEAAAKLSFDRAIAAAAVLTEQGIKWNQLRISSAGDSDRRTALAFDAKAHRTNQRAELIVTNDALPADPYSKEPGKP